jgi:transposase
MAEPYPHHRTETIALLMTTNDSTRKAETAATTGIPASQKPVIGGNFGLGVSVATVRKRRNRFAKDRLDGLMDEPRPGRPRKITDAKVDEVITKTLDTKPRDATHWSTPSMAREVGLTQTAVHDIWTAFGLKPRLQEKWKLSGDPQFVAKV